MLGYFVRQAVVYDNEPRNWFIINSCNSNCVYDTKVKQYQRL